MPSNNRNTWLDYGSKTAFLDAYNANPSSMKVSLEYFASHLKSESIDLTKALIVLGDMNELGNLAPDYHREIGELVSQLRLTNVIFVGRYAKDYLSGFSKQATCYDSVENLKENWVNHVQDIDYLLLKGSRSLQLESLLAIKIE